MSDVLKNFLIGVAMAAVFTAIGAHMAESDNRRDCDKLGRVVLDGKGFECREVGK